MRTVKRALGLAAGLAILWGSGAWAGTTTFTYDAFGNLISTVDPIGNVTSAVYDVRGRRTSASFPDLGTVTSTYDVFDEVEKEVDAKGQTVTATFDQLGRKTQQIEPDLTSSWTYDTAANGVGKLATATASNGYSRTFSYDTFSRQSGVSITIAGVTSSFATTYDPSTGRVSSATYPSGFKAKYAYTSLGYVKSIADASTQTVLWQANSEDAELHLTQYQTANGVVANQAFDPNTGYFKTIQAGAGSGTAVANFSYSFDTLDNLTSRTDVNENLTENFRFDALNRLTQYSIVGGATKAVSYDALGNITSKSDVGSYTYPGEGQAHPHAVSSITGTVNGVANPTFTYDANGNLTSGAGRTASYTSYDMPSQIQQGSTTIAFTYNGEHERITYSGPDGALQYLNDIGIGISSERLVSGSTVTWTDYLFDGTKRVGMRVSASGSSPVFSYFIQDHLGSVAVVTSDGGAVTQQLSYDAWGKRRQPTGQDDPSGSIRAPTRRGFTDHEMLDQVGLIDMNARVYDPLLGRFMTPDGMIPDPHDLQTYNRYTYVNNRPLSLTDPTGHFGTGAGSGVWAGGDDLSGLWGESADVVEDNAEHQKQQGPNAQAVNSDASSMTGAAPAAPSQAPNVSQQSNGANIGTVSQNISAMIRNNGGVCLSYCGGEDPYLQQISYNGAQLAARPAPRPDFSPVPETPLPANDNLPNAGGLNAYGKLGLGLSAISAAYNLKFIGEETLDKVKIPVYRVFDSWTRGKGAYEFGRSWGPQDPSQMQNWRDTLAVYPAWNKGTYYIKGYVTYLDLVSGRVQHTNNPGSIAGPQLANPQLGGGPYKGMGVEWLIPNAITTVKPPYTVNYMPNNQPQ